MATFYLSTAISGDIAQMIGAAHYSYHFAEQRFRTLLTAQGAAPIHLPMPECYATRTALRLGPDAAPIHLIFRSTAEIRLLKPAVNIACFAWEFPVLKSDTLPGEHPFLNQARMLNLCDEVWTPSTFACQVLRTHGVERVQHIPAPIPLPATRATRAVALEALGGIDTVPWRTNFTWSRAYGAQLAEAAMAPLRDWLGRHARPTIYLAIFNPEDFRKNLDAMLRGFHLFRTRHPGAVLIVKLLISRSRYSLPEVVSDCVANKLASGSVFADDGILLINAYLSDAEMSLLYSLADFYLCTSIAEGQNLPLLEAMAHGTIAVTTRNTAMEDYIDADNAFVIAGQVRANDNEHQAGTVARRAFDVSICGARDVHDALCRAQAAGKQKRARVARAGIATLVRDFSEASVWSRIRQRLAQYS